MKPPRDVPTIATTASLAALEWPSLLALVADEARTDLGARRLASLAPAGSEEELRQRRAAAGDVARLAAEEPFVPSFGVDFAPLLARLASGQPDFDGGEILLVASLVDVGARAAERIRSADPACPELASGVAELEDPAPLLGQIRRVLDKKGRIRDDASPRLTALAREIRSSRERLYERLTTLRNEHLDLFGEETVPMRGGRLLLVLSAGARGRQPGLVHGRSASGKSFYFEPLDVVEDNNQLQTAVEEQEAERQRLLNELVAALVAAAPLVESLAALVESLDAFEAMARWGRAARARIPEAAAAGHLTLRAARHPLLDPALAARRERVLGAAGHRGEIVELDLALDPSRRVLVVTGPNAGGKTVVAKTVGLALLAAQAGLPVPCAAGSALPFVENLVATVGDEQDLLADRSTFSGRLARLAEAWDAAGPASLAILDELGSGTEPEEGSALSIALLERLIERNALAIITTHLTAVAAAALETAGASCAAMEFDPESGRPTFRLRPGAPGGSEAIALARRLGLARQWTERAEALLGSEQRDLRRVLAELEITRGELARATDQAREATASATLEAARLERERATLEAERRVVGRKLEAELRAFRERVSRSLGEEEKRLRKEFADGRRRGVASDAVARLFVDAPAVAAADDEVPGPSGPLEVGARVRHRGLGWVGKLEVLDGDRAEVAVAGKRVRCRTGELVRLADGAVKTAQRSHRTESEASGEAPAELHLIGQRVEEALELLDEALDRALRGGRGEVRVVHGHGTGRLRDAVRRHLAKHRAVADYRPGAPNEGGNGATVVVLAG